MTFPTQRFTELDTPFYYYDLTNLRETLAAIHVETLSRPNFHVHYAVKANANPHILQFIAQAGLGADCVSGGEIEAAHAAGFKGNSIVYAGVGKSDNEIRTALRIGIHSFNVESLPELEVINQIAHDMGTIAHVAFRINPNVDAHTHAKITTGLNENKFGIAMEDMVDAIQRATPNINVGGGLGIDYDHPDANPIANFKDYFGLFQQHLQLREGQQLHFELGRSIVAQCGTLIARTLYVKEGHTKKFVIVDAGFTELIRPAMYGSHHFTQNISAAADAPTDTYDVVGPICESSDVFSTGEVLPITHRGDLIAFRSAGAYGEVMASTYNCRTLPKSYFSE